MYIHDYSVVRHKADHLGIYRIHLFWRFLGESLSHATLPGKATHYQVSWNWWVVLWSCVQDERSSYGLCWKFRLHIYSSISLEHTSASIRPSNSKHVAAESIVQLIMIDSRSKSWLTGSQRFSRRLHWQLELTSCRGARGWRGKGRIFPGSPGDWGRPTPGEPFRKRSLKGL